MTVENFIEQIEDLGDNQPIREFDQEESVPRIGDSTVITPQVYLESVNFMATAEGWFPLEIYSYVTYLHTNEIIIWNRYTKRINYRKLFNIIKN